MKELLAKEIELEFEELPNMAMGDAPYEKTVEGLTKLMSTQIELKKVEAEIELKSEMQAKQLEIEAAKVEIQKQQLDLQKQQNKHNKWETVLQVLTTVGLGIAGLAVTVWGTNYTMEYEDKGVMPTTLAGREHTKKLFNKK